MAAVDRGYGDDLLQAVGGMDRPSLSYAGGLALRARAIAAAVAGRKEARHASRDHLAHLAMGGVIDVVDLMVGAVLLRWHGDEPVAVVGDVWGPIEPALRQHGLKHLQRPTGGRYTEEGIVVESRRRSRNQDVGGTHGAMAGDGRISGLAPCLRSA